MSSNPRISGAIFLISSSAGELEWIAPFVDLYKSRGVQSLVFAVHQRARKSINQNQFAKFFLRCSSDEASQLIDSRYESIFELADKSYRGLRKLGLFQIDSVLERFFLALIRWLFLKHRKLSVVGDRPAIFMEFPADKKLLYRLMKTAYPMSVIFLFPHSPHPYHSFEAPLSEETDSPRVTLGDTVYLFGDARDPVALNASHGWNQVPNSKIMVVGHPKYSSNWINRVKTTFLDKIDSNLARNVSGEIVIGVLSRGYGSFINKDEQGRLVETLLKALDAKYKAPKLVVVKKHPREFCNTAWDSVKRDDLVISEDHVWSMILNCHVVVTFWSSAAIDASVLGKEAIELYDPQKFRIGQVKVDGKWMTVYGMAGFARSCSSLEGLLRILPDEEVLLGSKEQSPLVSVELKGLIDLANLGYDRMSTFLGEGNG